MKIKDFINNYKTKYEFGFIEKEIQEVLKLYTNINEDKFYNALDNITCMILDDEIITYHCDIINALNCGIENRDININEFD